MHDILFETLKGKAGDIGLITLNRPKALNALTLAMILEMQRHLSIWHDDNTIKAVVVKSNSEKAFCAGGDVRFLYDNGRTNKEAALDFFWHEYRLNCFIKRFNKPYICLLDGITMGGGVGISLHGNYPIATENFSFAMPETTIGFFPDVGGSYLLSHCKDHFGLYLALTGERINCADAVFTGLINYTLNSASKENFLEALLNSPLEESTIAALLKQYGFTNDMPSVLKEKKSIINNCFAAETLEAIIVQLKKEKDEWAEKIIAILLQKSPLSLKVTFEQLNRGRDLSMEECMKMEYRMVNQSMSDNDFYEGVRALLIDKDKNPQWQPQNIIDVDIKDIAPYFKALNKELELI